MDDRGMFLVCERCGYSCFVRGTMARKLAPDPPPCPGCGTITRLARRDPWREALDGLEPAS